MSAGPLNGTLSDGSSDSDIESLEQLTSEEIASHFQQRHGRLFHSHGTVPYPLPADELEMQRLNRMHDAMKLIFDGSNYCERLDEILTATPGERMRIADIGTGSGIWVDEMANEFPDFRFYGLDIVPTATQDPDPNVQYEVGKLERTGFRSASYHFVHMRQASLGIVNFGRAVAEVRRILRPGGYFYSADWIRKPFMADGSNVEQYAPRAAHFFGIVDTLLQFKSVPPDPDGNLMANALQQNRFEVNQTRHNVVLGDQGVLGFYFRRVFKEYADALKYLLLDSGFTAGNAEVIITGFKLDVDSVPGLTFAYHTVFARKLP